jgi:GT2 family glycosyltransferase
MDTPQVTIVVVPRERFSYARASLESIFEHTELPFKLVYVDAGSPRKVRRYLAAQADARGFDLIRTDDYLPPNRARNLALGKVDTKYVVFVDNDVLVSPGWLGPLVQCARDTSAAIVGPLICEELPAHELIHFAGGESHIEVRSGEGTERRHLIDVIYRQGERLADVRSQLARMPTEVCEFHCVLVRTSVLDRVGPFDEGLLSVRENLDFCMLVTQAGGSIYLEPASFVTYVGYTPLAWSDIPYYLLRWNRTWTLSSLQRLREKWDLCDDEYFHYQYRNLDWRHRDYLIQHTLLRWIPSWRIRKVIEKGLLPVDRMLADVVVTRYNRQQAAVPRGQEAAAR